MQFLSVNEMHHLRCKNCNNFLSCGPMFVWREGSTICGRCVSPKYSKSAQAFTFEQVIKTIKVPCRYWFRHCKELLYPDEVPLHEQVCIYKNRWEMFCGDLSAVFKMEKSLPHLKEPPKLLNLPRLALEWLLCTKCSLYLSSPGCYVNSQGRPFCFRCITTPPQTEYMRHVDLENLLGYMVFPCIFHMRGCTRRYRFGDAAGYSHEQECAYGFAAQRPISQLKTVNVNGKQKGVITTHTGHVFATITPNTIQLFANSGNWKDGQEKLLNNLQERVANNTGVEGEILNVNKLETNQSKPRLNDVRNGFRDHAPAPLNLDQVRRNEETTDSSIMRRSKQSPIRKDMHNSESIPISPVFVQQPMSSNYYPHYNSLQRRDSDISAPPIIINQKRTNFALPSAQQPPIIENQAETQTFPSPNNQATSNNDVPLRHNDVVSHLKKRPQSTSQPNSNGRPSLTNGPPPSILRMTSATWNSLEPHSDEFQAYGLPYGNTNLTHGVQPNVYGKEVTLERVPSVLKYNNIVSELKIKQKIAEFEDDDK